MAHCTIVCTIECISVISVVCRTFYFLLMSVFCTKIFFTHNSSWGIACVFSPLFFLRIKVLEKSIELQQDWLTVYVWNARKYLFKVFNELFSTHESRQKCGTPPFCRCDWKMKKKCHWPKRLKNWITVSLASNRRSVHAKT